MSTFAIHARALTKKFGNIRAIDDVGFEVEEGQVTALLGSNGAGKTTTIAILLGLLIPTSGSGQIFGRCMINERHDILPLINFSSPYVDLPNRLTIRENLQVYGELYSIQSIKRRIDFLAESLNFHNLLDRKTGQLSAGQKTRVALAKALINTPRLLLLDEPTASLDPDTADSVRSYLERYARDENATILLASHHMAEVERLCDNVLMMRAGKIVDRGSPKILIREYGRTNMEEVFLDVARNRDREGDL